MILPHKNPIDDSGSNTTYKNAALALGILGDGLFMALFYPTRMNPESQGRWVSVSS